MPKEPKGLPRWLWIPRRQEKVWPVVPKGAYPDEHLWKQVAEERDEERQTPKMTTRKSPWPEERELEMVNLRMDHPQLSRLFPSEDMKHFLNKPSAVAVAEDFLTDFWGRIPGRGPTRDVYTWAYHLLNTGLPPRIVINLIGEARRGLSAAPWTNKSTGPQSALDILSGTAPYTSFTLPSGHDSRFSAGYPRDETRWPEHPEGSQAYRKDVLRRRARGLPSLADVINELGGK